MDLIFKALNDHTRRQILDFLRDQDGQTVSEIVDQLDQTRFGVMKHLKILEEAQLVIARKDGRFKYHYLNAAPLQSVIERWIEPLLAKPTAQMAMALKAKLEGNPPVSKPDFVLETYIATTAGDLWNALINPEMIGQYYISGAKPASPINGLGAVSYDTLNGPMLSGEVLDYQEEKRLEMTFIPHWGQSQKSSRMVYEIEEEGQSCKLTILHYDIPKGNEGVKQGWSKIASGLKSLLETGKPLDLAS